MEPRATLRGGTRELREAIEKRSERNQFFAPIAEHLAAAGARRVLELGSGPGFLASHLEAALPLVELTLAVGVENAELFMTVDEQQGALGAARRRQLDA